MPQMSALRWQHDEERLRLGWERSYPNVPWNDVRYGYRYGWEQAARRHGRSWEEVEGELRVGWEGWQASTRLDGGLGGQLQQPWEDLRHVIRYAWERGGEQ